MKRWLIIGLTLIGVVALIAYGFRPQPVMVEATEASRASLRITVEEEGKTRVADTYVISAPVGGNLRRIALDEGDRVRAGQAVATLDPARAEFLDPRTRLATEARVNAAESQIQVARERLAAAQADAAYWEAELGRVRQLSETGDIPKERLDRTVNQQSRAAAVLREARHAVDVAQSELRAARAALQVGATTDQRGSVQPVVVTAPVAGRVLKVVKKSEGPVTPGQPLIEVGNANSLEVEVELLSIDAVKVAPGTPVQLTRWGGETPLDARVRTVEPQGFTKISALGVEEQRVLVILDIVSPPDLWSRLGAGYRVEASFLLWEGQNVLQVPASALFRQGEGWAVFTIEAGHAKRRPVSVGRRNGLTAEITSGLEQGSLVITHPDSSISDGTAVEVRAS